MRTMLRSVSALGLVWHDFRFFLPHANLSSFPSPALLPSLLVRLAIVRARIYCVLWKSPAENENALFFLLETREFESSSEPIPHWRRGHFIWNEFEMKSTYLKRRIISDGIISISRFHSDDRDQVGNVVISSYSFESNKSFIRVNSVKWGNE